MEIPRDLMLQTSIKWKTSLIGKLFTDTQLDPNEVMRAIRVKWNLKQKLHIVVTQGNLFIISFENEIDKNKILKNEPWQIMGYLLVLKKFSLHLSPQQIAFDTILFWITFTGLQLEHQSPEVIKLLASAAGTFREVDPAENTRMAVGIEQSKRVDLHKPLSVKEQ
ncbi:hypothetical protein IFM89_014156 [Coptis chinensis]|uniref:DUF4283 domain-containing protein n=1 Tax=Coptis chinensis TaxID=261450 RepID=A0A835HQL2_9MAGN|nr:hypothetical protein IFM89_014156 [Coptis chinensis]